MTPQPPLIVLIVPQSRLSLGSDQVPLSAAGGFSACFLRDVNSRGGQTEGDERCVFQLFKPEYTWDY